MIKPQTKKRAKSATRPSDYFPDLNEWPENWMGTEEDLEIGRGLAALFTPFIQHLIDEGLANKTIKNHANHLCMLGGEIIRNLDGFGESNRTLSPRDLILYYVNDEGGPLLSLLDLNDKTDLSLHMAYDATCRKFWKFMTRTGEEKLPPMAKNIVVEQNTSFFCRLYTRPR